jgi:hypothetical protein
MNSDLAEFKTVTDQIPGWPISKQSPLCYLATPYSRYRTGITAAFAEAARIAAFLLRAGLNVYSPIVNSHPLTLYGDLDPLDHKIWLPINHALMEVCDTLIVATMIGWEESLGVQHEIAWYREQKRRIFYLNPETLVMTQERLQEVSTNAA